MPRSEMSQIPSIILLLVFISKVAFADIVVNIQAAAESATVAAVGFDEDVISHLEQATFQVKEPMLKQMIYDAYGRRPDSIYLKGPTPWGDLYTKYGWRRVYRKLYPHTARILKIQSKPMVLKQKVIKHKGKPKVYNASLIKVMEGAKSVWWTTNHDLSAKQRIHFSLLLSDKHLYTFSIGYGQEYMAKYKMTIGTADMALPLNPKQEVELAIVANRVILEVEVELYADLEGQVACNFKKSYSGHHFWGFKIRTIMKLAGYPTLISSTLVMRFEFFESAILTAVDLDTDKQLISQSVPIIFEDDIKKKEEEDESYDQFANQG